MHTGDPEPNTDRTRLMAAADNAVPVAGRPPRLLIVSGIMLGHQIEVLEIPVTIGRATECTLSLPYPSVSRTHCRIYQVEGQVQLLAMGLS